MILTSFVMWEFGNQNNKAASKKRKKKKRAAEVGVSAVMSLAANSHDITENKHRGCPVVWTNMRL